MTISRAPFSSTRYAEPSIWCGFLMTVWLLAAKQQQDQREQPMACFFLLASTVAVGSCLAKQGTVSSIWRTPSSDKIVSDPSGVFLSLSLVPLLCIGLANANHDPHWINAAMLMALLNFYAWAVRGYWRLLLTPLFVSCIYWLDAKWKGGSLLWLQLTWLGLFYSMEFFLPKSFHGVFTQGEWMLVSSLASLAILQYTAHSSSEPTHGTVAMAGLLSVIITCPIMEVIKKIPVHKLLMSRQADEKVDTHQQGLITFLFQIPFWVGIPLLGVEAFEFLWSRSDYIPSLPIDIDSLPIAIEYIPKSLLWLVGFLLETESPIVQTSLPSIPRYAWLVYWLLVLAITIPFAPEPVQSSTNRLSNAHYIVLLRKWFHGIALLLFTPVTLAAPQLLSLSYAIALAILILLESARTTFPTIAQFHERYLDVAKDTPDGLVVSHMALILGCALPLWISELLDASNNEKTQVLVVLLQLWGVISLGIGDAMGAIVGVLCGRFQWSEHNARTLEGSLAMGVSMTLSCWGLTAFVLGGEGFGQVVWPCLGTVTLVTLLEAHTFQIDNLVLPLAGAASWLGAMAVV